MSAHESAIQRTQRLLSAGRIVRGLRVEGPPPTWLLLPAVGVGVSMWLPLLQALHGSHAAIAIDLAGFDASEIGKPDPTYAEQRALLAAYLDALHGPLILVACSTSAMLGAELARREQHRVDALILSGFGHFDDAGAWLARIQQLATAPASFLQAMLHTPLDDCEWAHAALPANFGKPAYLSFFDAQAHSAARNALDELEVPTLFIAGRQDNLVTPVEVERAASSGGSARVEWLERCGHLAPSDRPRAFLRAAQAFLASTAMEAQP